MNRCSLRQPGISDNGIEINRERGFYIVEPVPAFGYGVNSGGEEVMEKQIFEQIGGEPVVSAWFCGGGSWRLIYWFADSPPIDNTLDDRLIEGFFSLLQLRCFLFFFQRLFLVR